MAIKNFKITPPIPPASESWDFQVSTRFDLEPLAERIILIPGVDRLVILRYRVVIEIGSMFSKKEVAANLKSAFTEFENEWLATIQKDSDK